MPCAETPGTARDPVIWRVSRWNVTLSQLQYVTFTIIGVALLWPWNCFLSASAYYGERFAHSPGLMKIYSSTMMSVSTVTSTTYNYYLSQKQTGVDYKHRINMGLGLTIAVFVVMAFSCVASMFIRMQDNVFFVGLMGMVLVSAMATCLAQNGTMATVNVMGHIYTNAVMVGQAIAGILPSVALIVSILVVGDNGHGKAAPDEAPYVDKNFGLFVYYITASLVSMASIALLALIGWHKSDSMYRALTDLVSEEEGLEAEQPEDVPVQTTHVPFHVLWCKLKAIVLTIFLTFAVTLLFPVFALIVESVHGESHFVLLRKNIYIPFVYFVWNLGDLMGRVLCGRLKSRVLIRNPRTLITYSVGRLVFIPLFLTCNIHPLGKPPVLSSDVWYILLQFLFGFSNGQLVTSCFMVVGDHCDTSEEKEAAGGFTSVFLSVGLAVGSILSYLLVLLVD
ncbi:hypothetical protein METBIDRAFT_77757 [Metschnikowia bicuspidata var. bicuspidata NRRL YB-4993]|uniref:Major facilitator superfamily (MFS) profile domain-containing protein n=1 Tax=Metschnikowia bicuspidata var. bicuspidata NRRL YB-4993 TaxID=869754 RepID=A0A1A0HE96_9ASCO|nr:hypothetical protein METBIDRAFT_77757 [Metschnikowia bicuspidata var. bicuspidata NRRL YB-4993]OBA22316.1 hypothetical protein METBIDRAFT_77757 [Metschnikowia bicuspidata var. bicuspidata NRRL YB-4993]